MQSIVERCQEALLQYRQYMLELYSSIKQVEEKKLLMGLPGIKNNNDIIR